MGDKTPEMGNKLDEAGVVELTGKIMIIAIVILFLVVIFVFFLHIYAKWCINRRQQGTGNAASRRRLNFAHGHQELAVKKGLDPSVLNTIPIVVFSSQEFKDGLECAVCLCDVSEGEKTRLLPKCNHGFHVECIDMWFQSHSTCPLCRNPISSSHESPIETVLRVSVEENSPRFPTNVLFWGNENLEEVNQFPNPHSQTPSSSSVVVGSSSGTRQEDSLVIDIPQEINEEEEPKSPMPMRLRSFKRLLSRDRRINPISPRDFDVEEGTIAQR